MSPFWDDLGEGGTYHHPHGPIQSTGPGLRGWGTVEEMGDGVERISQHFENGMSRVFLTSTPEEDRPPFTYPPLYAPRIRLIPKESTDAS